MRVLADNGGYVLAEVDTRLLFFKRRILPTWLVFVAGLLTLIAAANAVIQVVAGNVLAAAVLLAVSAASGAGLRAVMQRRREARSRPLEARDALVQLDLAGRWLLDGSGAALSALDQVRVEKPMQVTSSARALAIAWPGGRCVVYRGDPFARRGSIDAPAEILKGRGLTTSW